MSFYENEKRLLHCQVFLSQAAVLAHLPTGEDRLLRRVTCFYTSPGEPWKERNRTWTGLSRASHWTAPPLLLTNPLVDCDLQACFNLYFPDSRGNLPTSKHRPNLKILSSVPTISQSSRGILRINLFPVLLKANSYTTDLALWNNGAIYREMCEKTPTVLEVWSGGEGEV